MKLSKSILCPFSLLLVLGSCVKGGESETPKSEVTITASHHMFGLRGLRSLSFPVPTGSIFPDRGTLVTKDDSTYTVKRPTGEGTDTYFLEESGVFMVLVDQGSRRPKARFTGAYGLDGNTSHYHFADRHESSNSPSIGLYMGTQLEKGTYDVEDDWHLFSQHVIFSASQFLDPDNVGRSVGGSIAIDKDGAITGSGTESTGASITFTGPTGAAKTFADGVVDLTIKYKPAQGAEDERIFHCGGGPNLIIGVDDGVDEGKSTGEAGLLGLIRKHDPANASKTKLSGLPFLIGVHTIFVTPTLAGTDGATGTLEFNANGQFKIDAVGAEAQDFSYSGSYTLANDGGLTLSVDGTNEDWMGAVDEEYKTVILIDHYVETRTGEKPSELNFFFGLRKGETSTK